MRTVRQVSDLTGISVRMLHYYDEIGLLKPSAVTESGYRLYDDEALVTLQQILFFKELDIPLKEVKRIMDSPKFNKMQALEKQKKLLIIKRNRLNDLVELINKTLKGENTMSFKEFDMTEYFNRLEELKKGNEDYIAKIWGSIEAYDEFIENSKSKEPDLAKLAIEQYESMDKFIEATKNNFDANKDNIEYLSTIKKKDLDYYIDKDNRLYEKITADITKAPSSPEIQKIVLEIVNLTDEKFKFLKIDQRDKGENYWSFFADTHLKDPMSIKIMDEKYGKGACIFIGKAFKFYAEKNK
ncbi:MAG: MerR family transcriptional regulator [Sedimentibacter sp.]|uniref:MerR family transcriptional regulator n=1 Tax=Sedimentibacter sp. TaxID=1960295 RepID=UPI003157F703